MSDNNKNYEEINDMLSAILAKNRDAFSVAFDSALTDRITSKLSNNHFNITSNLLKDTEDSSPANESTNNIIEAISLVLESNNDVILEFNDGDTISLGINKAKSLARLHDLLNINNQEHMKNSIVESKDAYDKIVKLAEEDKNVN